MAKLPTNASVELTAFNCPHCGAYTTQYWYEAYALRLEKNKTPYLYDCKTMRENMARKEVPEDVREEILRFVDNLEMAKPFLDYHKDGKWIHHKGLQLHFSECYTCEKFAIWHRDALIYPEEKQGDDPNPDLSAGVIRDFEEARSILSLSPRGAAALLRLCVQKICIDLGETDKTLDAAIGSLVEKGLDPHVQQSLDYVRVIGNEAVHPGQLDISDDRATALELFSSINLIATQMISNPKKARELYDKIPPEKRKAIEKRDAKGKGKS